MKRHLTLATRREHARRQVQLAAVSGAEGSEQDSYATAAVGRGDRPQRPSGGVPEWRHTLILTGRLDQNSAADLADEIECLRQEGVTTLTLDVGQLDGIDSPGAHVIATQGVLFEEEGRRFSVIPGALLTPELTGDGRVRNLMVGSSTEGKAPRFVRPRARGLHLARTTTMIQHLTPYLQTAGG
jgi:ABC-type transporter Mla MlaB component